ncbi:ADP/ATP carrier family protein [Desulfonema limicola]|uniref:ADP,ATP carrier protein n=1 Tax=Desulfonema limicola TaxID=45656 RepID=A0A975GHL9_9BACT|nr:Npt1/Npt2 family nucleotide transporter [Desulfonema limicola]QTA81660.1 ADP/ATP carrier family protein [Desulfonema limicola]
MFISLKNRSQICSNRYPALRKLWIRGTFLFVNFFLITMALYNLKPANKSLFIDILGADSLPYAWIGTALIMMFFIPVYHKLVARTSRFHIVLGTCFSASVILVIFQIMLKDSGTLTAILFYIFVDIIGVVLVEQFWSLTNTIYNTADGKKWYGIVGTGGPIGGIAGGWTSALLIRHTWLQTHDLLLTASGIIMLIFFLTWIMGYLGIYCEADMPDISGDSEDGWRFLGKSRYLILITAILLLSQLAASLIDYQFLKTLEIQYSDRETRTAFLSMIFGVMGMVSVLVNIFITPLIHRNLGVIAGMFVQPFITAVFAFSFLAQPGIFSATAVKISDRGLFNSINRASKELLYVPVNPVLIYQAKAWIDMFGFRMFKVLGSLLILFFTQWLPFTISVRQLSWFTIGFCLIWIGLIIILRTDYRLICKKYFA